MSNLFYESLTLTEDEAYSDIFTELSVKTNNWENNEGEVRYSDKSTADIAASILGDRYSNVKIEPLDYEDGKDLSYHITYSDGIEEKFDPNGLNWFENKNPIGTPLGGGTGMGEDYEPGDDEIECPLCGGLASYVEAQGFYEFYKCLDCGEYIAKDTKGRVIKADDAFNENGDVLTEDKEDDSFEAAQEYYASLEKPEQTNKLNELNKHFKELGFDIVDFQQTIPSKEHNMYFSITKLDGGEDVAKYEKAIVSELEKLGFKNIDISQAINYKGKAYIHGGAYLDGMTLEEDTSDKQEDELTEDTVKQKGKWVNKGKEGTHGKFNTKKAADAQRRAIWVNLNK